MQKYVIFEKSKQGVPAAGRPYLRIFRYAKYAEYAGYAKYAITSSALCLSPLNSSSGHVCVRHC